MSDTPDPLTQPANIRKLRKLYQSGMLNKEAFEVCASILRPRSEWFPWIEHNLLFLGTALLLSGIIFFFAYNWAAMGKFFKLGLIETAMAACAIACWFLKNNRVYTKLLLLCASVLLGVLMAVFGQTYQTGADAFELFAGWAVLILGWVIVAEFTPLWFIWLVIVNTATILYWIQVMEPCHSASMESLTLTLASINITALVTRELVAKHRKKLYADRWFRATIVAAILIALSISPVSTIFEIHSNLQATTTIAMVATMAWITASTAGYFFYRYQVPDMPPIALIVINLCVLPLSLIGRLIFNDTCSNYGPFMFLLFAVIIIAVVSTAAFLLKIVASRMAAESGAHIQ